MSALHLIEAPLDLRALHEWAERRGLTWRGGIDEGQVLHHLLGETFGPRVLQPFRLMVAKGAARATLFAYSPQDAASLQAVAQNVATPDAAAVLPATSLRSLQRPASAWCVGQRLGFDVKLRPVVRLSSDVKGAKGGFAKGAEIDVYLAAKLRDGTDSRDREAVYLDWLAARLQAGADLERPTTRIARYQRTRISRNSQIDGPEVIFQGTLNISEPDTFAGVLARGPGRHRAYGYGMLLLRPPARRC
jgi:CRISPR system Cascade subunit CasE